jgi:cell division protein FtsW
LIAGFLLVLVLSHTHYRFFTLGILLMLFSAALLILTMRYGISENEATRWLSLFGTPLQPSEFGKLACIIYVAFLLSTRERLTNKRTTNYIAIGIGLICLLILPSNLSTALILGTVCFLMMFIGLIPLKELGILLLKLLVLIFALVILLCVIPKDVTSQYFPRFTTWQNRVQTFIGFNQTSNDTQNTNATYQITDENYQISHAKIAIAQGGIFGKGPGRSTQRDFLPQAFSDFIYAIIIEETGVAGGIIVLVLYLMLLIRVVVIARRCEKQFPKYLTLGCGLLIVFQALIHMAVSVGLFPVTGQPLPLISRGGTSILITSAYFGIILSVSHFGANMSEDDEDENEVAEEEEEEEEEELVENNHQLATKTSDTEL